MSINLEAAFNWVLKLQSRPVELWDPDNDITYNLNAAPANYFRNLQGLEDMVIEGREFIISKKEAIEAGFDNPKRSWKITDPDMGDFTISEVKQMVGLGNIIGYRLRTN